LFFLLSKGGDYYPLFQHHRMSFRCQIRDSLFSLLRRRQQQSETSLRIPDSLQHGRRVSPLLAQVGNEAEGLFFFFSFLHRGLLPFVQGVGWNQSFSRSLLSHQAHNPFFFSLTGDSRRIRACPTASKSFITSLVRTHFGALSFTCHLSSFSSVVRSPPHREVPSFFSSQNRLVLTARALFF